MKERSTAKAWVFMVADWFNCRKVTSREKYCVCVCVCVCVCARHWLSRALKLKLCALVFNSEAELYLITSHAVLP